MPKSAPTTTIRDDHKYWKCKQSFVGGRTCNEKNEMSEKQCPSCGSKRDVEDEALDVGGSITHDPADMVFLFLRTPNTRHL
ncbi:hypothetical protein BHE90_008961 [Fusarium euwallaceae]|uniref:RanBP2-type domain-containing protein n=1 Tax=Fusarium euwallaceae TaxID=1147111 RepID=A0A430LLJ4_9HYPO|nr:hypothetical protein BHE90_008961 [Fusarium euwallaceae]